MKKNSLYNYITKNQKTINCDVILYEYENPNKKYIIVRGRDILTSIKQEQQTRTGRTAEKAVFLFVYSNKLKNYI